MLSKALGGQKGWAMMLLQGLRSLDVSAMSGRVHRSQSSAVGAPGPGLTLASSAFPAGVQGWVTWGSPSETFGKGLTPCSAAKRSCIAPRPALLVWGWSPWVTSGSVLLSLLCRKVGERECDGKLMGRLVHSPAQLSLGKQLARLQEPQGCKSKHHLPPASPRNSLQNFYPSQNDGFVPQCLIWIYFILI